MVTRILFYLAIFSSIVLALYCKSPKERKKEEARLDSLRNDSLRPVHNPYKMGQGTKMYDRERENLGKLDSMVTPAQPDIHVP